MTQEKEQKSSAEQKPDRVGDAFKRLKADVTKTQDAVKLLTNHEELTDLANKLRPELANNRLYMTKEQLEKLTFEANLQATELKMQTIEKIVADQNKETERAQVTKTVEDDISSLEQRYKALEQYADRRPEWVKSVQNTVGDAWTKFRSISSVGQTLDWIGELTGKTIKSSTDLWALVKGTVLGSIAAGDFTKNKKIMDWANMKLNEDAVAEGIQFAVNKAQKGQTFTEMQGDKKVSISLKVKFEPKFSADDIRAWEGVLSTGGWGKLTPAVATEYVDAYVRKYADQYKDKEMPISVDALVKEGLTKNQPIAGPQASPEVPQSLFGIAGIKLNERRLWTSKTPFIVGTQSIVLESGAITIGTQKYTVKLGPLLPDYIEVQPTSSSDAGAAYVYWKGATAPLFLRDIVNPLVSKSNDSSVSIPPLIFEKVPTA